MLKIASPGAVSSFVGSEMFATEKGVLNEKLVNFPKKVHSGLAQWLTSAIHDNKHNRRTAGPCVWCLCLRTSALSKHPGVLLPGEAHALPCLQETLPKEAETLSLGWRLCSLRTSHAGTRDPVEVAGPLGTPLGLAQRKRASPRGTTGGSCL